MNRDETCADMGHPGVTVNPWLDKTWCLCGGRIYPGRSESVDQHLACCDGPLTGLDRAPVDGALL